MLLPNEILWYQGKKLKEDCFVCIQPLKLCDKNRPTHNKMQIPNNKFEFTLKKNTCITKEFEVSFLVVTKQVNRSLEITGYANSAKRRQMYCWALLNATMYLYQYIYNVAKVFMSSHVHYQAIIIPQQLN